MNPLSLQRINQKAPYHVVRSAKDVYCFSTDRGVDYSIAFMEDNPLGGCDTYQFAIRKISNLAASYDADIEVTVLAIIDEFFFSNLNVLLYICDTSDHREEARNRLFLQWFERNAVPDRFTIRTANAIVEGEGFYAAIIVENRNPKLQAITEEFEETSRLLAQDKPE